MRNKPLVHEPPDRATDVDVVGTVFIVTVFLVVVSLIVLVCCDVIGDSDNNVVDDDFNGHVYVHHVGR